MTLEHFDTVLSFVMILAGVSLLVTTLTQSVSALLGLRGGNLRWGLETLLRHADPKLAEHARTISEKVLQHPLISDSRFSGCKWGWLGRWRLASGIHRKELVEILHHLAKTPEPGAPETGKEPWDVALGRSLENLTAGAVENLSVAAPEIQRLFPSDPARADRVIEQMLKAGELTAGHIQFWFDAVMARVSQRFLVHIRIWTVIFSVVLAFALHMDAFKLLTRLSSDSDLRAQVISSADVLNRKADEILASGSNASPLTCVEAMRLLMASHPEDFATNAPPSSLAGVAAAERWLRGALKPASAADKLVAEFETLVPQAQLRVAADNFHSMLTNKLALQLVPDPYPQPFYRGWAPGGSEFWGILASAALLSLGAPFWFNLLKTLSTLRPVLAAQTDANAKAG